MLEGKKTDWNDVLLKRGVQDIKNQVFNKNSFIQKINEEDTLDKKDLEKIKLDSFVKYENINTSAIYEATKNLNLDKNKELINSINVQDKFNKSISSPSINSQKNIEKELDL